MFAGYGDNNCQFPLLIILDLGMERCAPPSWPRKKFPLRHYRDQTRLHGLKQVSIIYDGWKDCQKPLINSISMSPKGVMLLKAIDCDWASEACTLVANIFIQTIDMVGLENGVQVIIDNAENCRATSSIAALILCLVSS